MWSSGTINEGALFINLGYKQTEQGDDGFVLDGYICFFLMNCVSGVSLKNGFWDLELTEREDIRTALEAAYK
jgi:hypothetical protein